MILKLTRAVVLWCCVLAVVGAMANRSAAEQEEETYSYYRVDARVVSLDANQSLASYRSYGGGSGSPGSTLGYPIPEAKVRIELTVESDRFYANVTICRHGESEEDDAKKRRIDLTNLRPTFLDLGADQDGRVYQLNLTPSVTSVRLSPEPFQKVADDLYCLRFHSSRITLNDKQYIGRMLASDAEVFSVDVCGTASLEFSLCHLKDAEPCGRLQDGQITLNHPDGTSIEIGNVTNGADDRLISGGPYLVWVRWGKPKQTVEEYRAELAARRDRVKSGDVPATAGTLAILDRELAREPGPWVVSSGARGLRSDEIVRDE
jgi:hypothetical protein